MCHLHSYAVGMVEIQTHSFVVFHSHSLYTGLLLQHLTSQF